MLTLEDFKQTCKPMTDEFWNMLNKEKPISLEELQQDQCFLYADEFMIQEVNGLFCVHAWWYAPIAYDTREEAEEKLYPWYQEWQ